VLNAKEAKALLRSRRAALCNVQLLPLFAITGDHLRAKSVREGTRRGAPWVRFSSCGIRVDAQLRCVMRRIGRGVAGRFTSGVNPGLIAMDRVNM
jgi:hypothetical protein